MVPFIVFLAVTAVSAAIRLFVAKSPLRSARDWQRPLAHGMAAMFLIAASGHFIEPLRSGLIATVPPIIPLPDLVVSAAIAVLFLHSAWAIVRAGSASSMACCCSWPGPPETNVS